MMNAALVEVGLGAVLPVEVFSMTCHRAVLVEVEIGLGAGAGPAVISSMICHRAVLLEVGVRVSIFGTFNLWEATACFIAVGLVGSILRMSSVDKQTHSESIVQLAGIQRKVLVAITVSITTIHTHLIMKRPATLTVRRGVASAQ